MQYYLNYISRIHKGTAWLKLTLYICLLPISPVFLQTFYISAHGPQYGLYSLEIGEGGCNCEILFIDGVEENNGFNTFTPDSTLITFGTTDPPVLNQIDYVTGEITLFFDFAPIPLPNGIGSLVTLGGGVFYGMQHTMMGIDILWKFDINDGSITPIGNTGFNGSGDLALFNGEVYYYSTNLGFTGIVKVNLINPSNSTLVVEIPPPLAVAGLTASPYCNTLLGITGNFGSNERNISTINLIDGAVTHICDAPIWSLAIASMLEFAEPAICDNTLDLDCNDSSGATGADYNSSVVTCLMRQATVADEDVRMFYDAIISEMTIRVTGFMPDGLNELIDITGSIPGIDVSGQGTDILTLSNAGGAKSTDFIDALHLVRYMNTALNPAGGQRTIEVQFTTESGGMSNVAIVIYSSMSCHHL